MTLSYIANGQYKNKNLKPQTLTKESKSGCLMENIEKILTKINKNQEQNTH
jgi:hypothetical protein